VAVIKWIRSRFRAKKGKNHKYFHFPHELIQETSIEKIFLECDTDGSGGLSRTEIFEMFSDFGIRITMEDLDELYDSVEVDLEELDCNMFKKCALSERSNQVFRKIVNKNQNGDYYPHHFTKVIIYIVFLSKRKELKQSIAQSTLQIATKVGNMSKILKLNDLAVNNERLANHTQKYKQDIRNKLRDIWEKVNENYEQCFPF
jgi:Ca2+-binding EF-hand superfamily protein